MAMKYVLSWFERPQGSPMEYENAQKRILEVFGQWKAPGNFKIDFFVIRVGEWGGHMLMECDDPVTIHKFCSMLPAFVFEVHPVIPVEEAVRGELEVIAWRDGLEISRSVRSFRSFRSLDLCLRSLRSLTAVLRGRKEVMMNVPPLSGRVRRQPCLR
jgi:hypothetical protein